ncbi:hypothetical protein DLJ49_01755 [Rhodovulum sp. 12E13]|uniref:hypothetical protein n=1 Tax=Rhodovulum sp. 12E13 TaxID=2203891 RepID=UPI000E1A560E|nr:hypothetical protein [Rhodovulum sp. 12E13]RDC74733.1 hypothetical protein DLJ49_01755 [Rhodovulum sp. 12E13]
MAWSLPYTLTVAALVAGPSVVTATIAEIIGDPRLRPLSLSEMRLAASDARIEIEGPYVRTRIYWAGPSQGYATPDDLRMAVREALAAKGVEAHVAIMASDGGETLLDMRAGRSAFGPFPVADAARHVVPAAEAARLAFSVQSARTVN